MNEDPVISRPGEFSGEVIVRSKQHFGMSLCGDDAPSDLTALFKNVFLLWGFKRSCLNLKRFSSVGH